MKITLTLDVTQEQLLTLFGGRREAGTDNRALSEGGDLESSLRRGKRDFGTSPEAYRFDPANRRPGQIGRSPKLNDEGFKVLWAMHLAGESNLDIGRAVGLNRETVRRIVKKISAFKSKRLAKA